MMTSIYSVLDKVTSEYVLKEKVIPSVESSENVHNDFIAIGALNTDDI